MSSIKRAFRYLVVIYEKPKANCKAYAQEFANFVFRNEAYSERFELGGEVSGKVFGKLRERWLVRPRRQRRSFLFRQGAGARVFQTLSEGYRNLAPA